MRRLQWLDALRGLAALMVLSCHTANTTNPEFLKFSLQTFNLGHLGVVLFFLISGYVIPISLRGGQRQFWIRRSLRLLPLYWLILAYQLMRLPWPGWWVFVVNVIMVPELTGVSGYVGGGWTLGIELVWYSLIAVLVWLRIDRYYIAIWTLLSSAALFVDGIYPILSTQVPPALFTYLPIFWSGYVIERWTHGNVSGWLAWGLFVATLALVTFPPPPRGLLLWANEFNHLVPRILAFALFGAVVLWGRRQNWPRWLLWSGERCYGIYLLHGLTISSTLAPVLGPVGALVLAELSWRLIEKPLIHLGRK